MSYRDMEIGGFKMSDNGTKLFFVLTFFYLILLNPLIASKSEAQTISERPDLRFERIHEGLMSNRVTAIYQDYLGYIWVGTHSGLHRYDGINFKIYSNLDGSNSLLSNYISDIFEDSQGNLWIGTVGGINRYNRDKDNFTNISFDRSVSQFTETSGSADKIVELQDGSIWVSGGGDALYKLDSESNRFILKGNFAEYGVSSITSGDQNTIWMATSSGGIIHYDPEREMILKHFLHDPTDSNSLPTNNFSDIILDRFGFVWASSLGYGLIKIHTVNGTDEMENYRHQPGNHNSLGNNFVFSLYEDNDGRLWVGNENGGLHLYDREANNFYRFYNDPADPESITDDSIWSVLQDRDGRIWIGTGQTGINVSDPYGQKFLTFNFELARSGIRSQVIRDILEVDDGNIWLATDGGGITLLDRQMNSFTTYVYEPENRQSISADAAIHLNQDNDGRLWIGTYHGGLDIMPDPTEGMFINFRDWIGGTYDYAIQSVFTTHFDGLKNYLWIGSIEEALLRYDLDSGELMAIGMPEGNNALSFVTYLFEDSAHNIWVATLEGLVKIPAGDISAESAIHFLFDPDIDKSIRSNSINHITEDHTGTIWIGTTAGLSKYTPENGGFVTYDERDGLPSNDVRSIVEDDNGELWIGTNNGLARYDPVQEVFKNYFSRDGLQGNEFSRYAAKKLASGELIFGGMHGFNLFHPDRVLDNPHIPPVYLTDFRLLNRPVEIRTEDSPLKKHISMTESMVLKHDQNIITFEFTALNYTHTANNQYAYMMEGFDSDWNYVGNQRNATYTNLDPGEYVFRVKASNNDGVWNEEGVALFLTITPPFWQTGWFYLFMILLLTGTVFSVYRYRVRSIKARNIDLNKQVAERTEELKVKNRALKSTLKELEETKDQLVEQAHKAGMADIASGVLHNIGNILNSINTSASLIEETANQSKVVGFVKANTLLKDHMDQIGEFMTNDPRGIGLMNYYLKLEKPLTDERTQILDQTERLIEKIQLVNDVIAAQQNYAGIGFMNEKVMLSEMAENALALQSGSIERHGLNIKTDYPATDTVTVSRIKLIHVLINIFKNAKEAMSENDLNQKDIEIKSWQDDENIYLSISDNGIGVHSDNLNKIFTHGFTTKKSGHGFGLHSSANYVKEMGGKIKVSSDGPGKGATFTLSFPKVKSEK